MESIIDLHIHSCFSRATSKQCNLEGLYYWGKLKGINVIGTGDFTHPDWFAEIQDKLELAEDGLMYLKSEISSEIDKTLPKSFKNNPLCFIPTAEISTIYSKGGKVRKLHQVIVTPDFKAVSVINSKLDRIGNLKADGRPILGLDSKELLRITLESSPDTIFIPAHIWTPWFGLFGSKSGFDSISEAYEELSNEIKAIETGLSSDPSMNWRVSELEKVTILSNSDAHSPQKLGREASIINSDLSYSNILGAIKTNDQRFVGTIEFFPQEGKYHADGHRACDIRFTPQQTKEHKGICPKCNKPLVVGVDYRVDELADRPVGSKSPNNKQVEYIIPLPEVIAEIKDLKSTGSKSVTDECDKIYHSLGTEFDIMRKIPIDTIREAGFKPLSLAVERIRNRDVILNPGYDGVFGTIKVFKNKQEREQTINQLQLL